MRRSGSVTLAIALTGMALAVQTASADDKLAGNWKLRSWVMEDVETKEAKAAFGERPNADSHAEVSTYCGRGVER